MNCPNVIFLQNILGLRKMPRVSTQVNSVNSVTRSFTPNWFIQELAKQAVSCSAPQSAGFLCIYLKKKNGLNFQIRNDTKCTLTATTGSR